MIHRVFSVIPTSNIKLFSFAVFFKSAVVIKYFINKQYLRVVAAAQLPKGTI